MLTYKKPSRQVQLKAASKSSNSTASTRKINSNNTKMVNTQREPNKSTTQPKQIQVGLKFQPYWEQHNETEVHKVSPLTHGNSGAA